MIRLLVFLVLVLLPIADLWLLVRIAGAIGPMITFLLVLGGVAVGVGLVRDQGARLLRAPPPNVVIEGILVVLGGMLLAAPGVITDVLGLPLLLPPARELLAPRVARWIGLRPTPSVATAPPQRPFANPFDDLP